LSVSSRRGRSHENEGRGNPSLSQDKVQHLNAAYAATAEKDVSLQLGRAGVRLAALLNTQLGTEPTKWENCLKGGQ
jgi:hypothetical protein